MDLRLRWARVVGMAVVAGTSACTILFDSNDLPRIADASDDAMLPIDAHEDFDVNPAQLAITKVDPATLVEGTGSAGGWPALVVLEGNDIADDVTVQVVPGADTVPIGFVVGTPIVSADHTMVAVAITVPEIDTLADQAQLHLKLKISQAGATDQLKDLTIGGLDPFTPAAGNVDAGTLKALYSSATFSAAVHFTGTVPAHLRVTGGITIKAAIDANAGTPAAGPGGCNGGGATATGGCGTGGGGGATSGISGSSGGGGGFAADADPGSGGTSGNGGAGKMSGEPMLTSLDYDPGSPGNRGNGGGGGGGGVGAGGAGGGGGGTIELTAGGTITITGGTVASTGGTGAKGGGLTGGDGGGGSGGAILIRTGAGIASSGEWISADKGTSQRNGGAGALGRIRVDTPNSATNSVTAMASTPHAHQGPSWAATTNPIARSANVSLPLVGEAGRTYGLIVDNVPGTAITLAGTSTIDVPVTLTAGHNRVCAVADSSASSSGNDVALECLDVVYVP